MRITHATGLLLLAFSTTSFAMDKDHQKHMIGSIGYAMAADVACAEVFKIETPVARFFCAAGTSFALGVAKEAYDSRQPNNHFDKTDLKYDAIGAVAGAGAMWVLRDIRLAARYDYEHNELSLVASVAF